MALVSCPECSAEMSNKAAACPRCGAPNAVVQRRSKDLKQNLGCFVIFLAIPAFMFLTPIVGTIVGLIGLAVVITNTRLM